MKRDDKILDRLNSIDKTLAAQHVSLKDHIRRTEILEQSIKPIQSHVERVRGVGLFLGILASIAAIIELFMLAHK